MSNFFISTGALTGSLRAAVITGQRELASLQKEIASGKKDDVGVELGQGSSELVSSRQFLALNAAIKGSNEVASSRLQASQLALETVGKLGNELLSGALTAGTSKSAAAQITDQARVLLRSFTSTANTDVGGVYVFGGLNDDGPPLADYFGSGSAARSAFQAAFEGAFGITPGDESVNGIDPSEIAAFIQNQMGDLFDGAGWARDWSSASAEVPSVRVGLGEVQETGASAAEAPFRQLAKALVLVGELGDKNFNEQTRSVIMEKATEMAGAAIAGFVAIRSRLGQVEERIDSANERLSLQSNFISKRISALEDADPFTASTELNGLMQRMEASYAATVRIRQLSVLDYL